MTLAIAVLALGLAMLALAFKAGNKVEEKKFLNNMAIVLSSFAVGIIVMLLLSGG